MTLLVGSYLTGYEVFCNSYCKGAVYTSNSESLQEKVTQYVSCRTISSIGKIQATEIKPMRKA